MGSEGGFGASNLGASNLRASSLGASSLGSLGASTLEPSALGCPGVELEGAAEHSNDTSQWLTSRARGERRLILLQCNEQ